MGRRGRRGRRVGVRSAKESGIAQRARRKGARVDVMPGEEVGRLARHDVPSVHVLAHHLDRGVPREVSLELEFMHEVLEARKVVVARALERGRVDGVRQFALEDLSERESAHEQDAHRDEQRDPKPRVVRLAGIRVLHVFHDPRDDDTQEGERCDQEENSHQPPLESLLQVAPPQRLAAGGEPVVPRHRVWCRCGCAAKEGASPYARTRRGCRDHCCSSSPFLRIYFFTHDPNRGHTLRARHGKAARVRQLPTASARASARGPSPSPVRRRPRIFFHVS